MNMKRKRGKTIDDLISRAEAIEAVQNRHMMLSKEKVLLINDLEKLPSAQPEPSQVARDIASIVENEKDMRVIAHPEIIRCKDCKNWDTTWTNDFSPNYHYCPMVDGVRKEDWYCADAERRTE